MKRVVFLMMFFSMASQARDCELTTKTLYENSACLQDESFKSVSSAYSKMMGMLNSDTESQKYLEQSEKTWIKYRDASCSLIDVARLDDETPNWFVYGNCIVEFNNARVATLNRYIKLMQSQ